MHLNKHGLNRAYDIRGFQSTIDFGAEIFALILKAFLDFAWLVEMICVRVALDACHDRECLREQARRMGLNAGKRGSHIDLRRS